MQDLPPTPPLSTWLPVEGLLVLAAAGATATVASRAIIFVPAVLAYGILAYLRLHRFRQATAARELEPVRPDLSAIRPDHAARVARCVNLQAEILSEIQSADAERRAMLAPSLSRVRGLVGAAAELGRRLQKLAEHLGAEDLKRADQEARTIERRAAESQDPAARRSLERALDQHRQKAAVILELRARWERGCAQLTTIELTLETVAAQILRIKSAEAGAASPGEARVTEALDALSIEVEAAAEAVDEAAEPPAPGRSSMLQRG